LAFDGRALPFAVATGHEPRCPSGELRIITLQALVIGGKATFVRRGGCERPARGSRCTLQPTVHVSAGDLAPVKMDAADRDGNGNPVRSCTRTVFNNPRSVGRQLERMYYKQPSELRGHKRVASGARWSNYGNPGRRFGSANYSYLLWNLPRSESGVLPGGGIVEAVLGQGQAIRLCEVAGLALPSFDAHGMRNGLVRFDYARVSNASQTIYGWILRGYKYEHDPFKDITTAPTSNR
jgi:hypothetical protein